MAAAAAAREVWPPAASGAVMIEQFRYLMEHSLRAQLEPEICAVGAGRVCAACVRYERLRRLLLAPFERSNVQVIR